MSEQSETRAERVGRHLRMLDELIEMGMELARVAFTQAMAQLTEAEPAAEAAAPKPGPRKIGPDHAAAFARLASSVRQTIAQAERLDRPPPERVGRKPAETKEQKKLRARVKWLVDEAVAHVGAAAGEMEVLRRIVYNMWDAEIKQITKGGDMDRLMHEAFAGYGLNYDLLLAPAQRVEAPPPAAAPEADAGAAPEPGSAPDAAPDAAPEAAPGAAATG